MLEQVARRLKKANARHKHRSDADLQQRADQVNQKYFNGQVQWNAIRWVSNMQAQLGSCSRGGPTDGEIRISDKIRDWPGWVLDYVIAHELMHRRHPNHSPAFWSELRTIYPLTDKARGFISGAAYVAGHPLDDAES